MPHSPASKKPGPWLCGMVASFVVRATFYLTAPATRPTASLHPTQEWLSWGYC